MTQDYQQLFQTFLDRSSRTDLFIQDLDSIEQVSNSLKVQVKKDGLSLAEKISIEKDIIVFFKEKVPSLNTTVLFKRKTTPSPKPAKKSEVVHPYGLKLNALKLPNINRVIAICSGKGGVGKSTVSANLGAYLASQGKKVGLLDADIYGPSQTMIFGVKPEDLPTVRDDNLQPVVAHQVKLISFGMLSDVEKPLVWRGPMVAKAFKQLCHDVEWGPLDYLLIDLPPGTGDVQLAMLESLQLDGSIVVTTPQGVALLDVQKAVNMFTALDVPILGVVENMAAFQCKNCGHIDHLFGTSMVQNYCEDAKIRYLDALPLVSDISLDNDSGQPSSIHRKNIHQYFKRLSEQCEL